MSAGQLLLLAFPLLAGLAGAALLIQSDLASQRRVAARLSRITPAARNAAPRVPIGRKASRVGPAIRLLGLLGCDWTRRQLYPVRWWLVLIGAAIAGRVAALLASGLLGEMSVLLWPAASVMLSRTIFRGWARSRQERLLVQFADALGMIVRTVRVGVPVVEGIKLVAAETPDPTRAEFKQLAEQIAIGTRLDEAVLAMADRIDMPEYRFFATTILLQAQTGGGLTEALDNLADVVRRRIALKARGYALTSEARTSAKVLTGLPFLTGAGMLAVAPDYMDPLIYTDLGHEMIAVAVLSLTVGAFVMRALVKSVLA